MCPVAGVPASHCMHHNARFCGSNLCATIVADICSPYVHALGCHSPSKSSLRGAHHLADHKACVPTLHVPSPRLSSLLCTVALHCTDTEGTAWPCLSMYLQNFRLTFVCCVASGARANRLALHAVSMDTSSVLLMHALLALVVAGPCCTRFIRAPCEKHCSMQACWWGDSGE